MTGRDAMLSHFYSCPDLVPCPAFLKPIRAGACEALWKRKPTLREMVSWDGGARRIVIAVPEWDPEKRTIALYRPIHCERCERGKG